MTLKNTLLQIMMILYLFTAVLPQAPQTGKQNSYLEFLLFLLQHSSFFIHAVRPTTVRQTGTSRSVTLTVTLSISLAAVAIVIIVFVLKKVWLPHAI